MKKNLSAALLFFVIMVLVSAVKQKPVQAQISPAQANAEYREESYSTGDRYEGSPDFLRQRSILGRPFY